MASTLEAALSWAARGFRVFPLWPGSTKPVDKGWTETATTDPNLIRGLFAAGENVGVLTTGMVVVDIDVKDGKPGLDSWGQLHNAWDTLTVRTPSGGYHLYYSGPDVANSVSGIAPGLDVRSYHGYVVAPGSRTEKGEYVLVQDVPMAPVPDAVFSRCKPPGERSATADTFATDPDTPAALHFAAERIAQEQGAVAGEQSERAYKLAAEVRDLGVSELMANQLMMEWAARCYPPLMPDDLAHRVANAYRYAQNAGGSKLASLAFQGVNIPPVPERQQPVYAEDVEDFGNALEIGALQRRPWIMHGLLIRHETTSLVSPGAGGKSAFIMHTAVCLAAGIDCFNYRNMAGSGQKSIIYNAEDSLNEMSMRLYAACQIIGIEPSQIVPHIRLISGKEERLRLVHLDGNKLVIIEEDVLRLTRMAINHQVAMVSMDPLGKLHTAHEIDNAQMGFVMDVIEGIAVHGNCAAVVAQHTSKAGSSMAANDSSAGRGGAAVRDSTRVVIRLNPCSDEDAAHYGLRPSEQIDYLRLDDAKFNYGRRRPDPTWLKREGIKLWHGEEVVAYRKVDMFERTESMRTNMAMLLESALRSRSVSTLNLTDATAVLKKDPLFGKMDSTTIRSRIQAMLSDPVELSDGSHIKAVDPDSKNRWMVVLE